MSSFRVSQMRHGSRRLPEDVNPISELDATSWPEYLDAMLGIGDATTTTTTKARAMMTARWRWQNIRDNDSLHEIVRSTVVTWNNIYVIVGNTVSPRGLLVWTIHNAKYTITKRTCRVSKRYGRTTVTGYIPEIERNEIPYACACVHVISFLDIRYFRSI